MVRHIVMWKFKEEAEGRTKEENINLVRNRLFSLPAVIPQIRKLEMGHDLRHTEMSADLVLIIEFDNLDTFQAYADHPEHLAVSQYVRKVIENRQVIDVQF